MKLISAVTIGFLAVLTLFGGHDYNRNIIALGPSVQTVEEKTEDDFEKAVRIIKKYESLHGTRHWPFVGYGHKVMPGEKFSRKKALSEKEADALLRKDLLKGCAKFRSYGADSLLLAVLAYNIGPGAAQRSSVAKKLKAGDRNIYENYIAHSKYRGKTLSQLKRRRIEEFETLFIKETEVINEIGSDNLKETETNELKEEHNSLTFSLTKPRAARPLPVIPTKLS